MPDNSLTKIIVICGPTASGKSDLALKLAHEIDAEIVNADSMQIYRHLDIGTAKPSAEQQAAIRHHLIDSVDPDQPFSAADYATAAVSAISDIVSRGKRAIVVGGTGLYIKALLKGLIDSPGADDELRGSLLRQAAAVGNEGMLELLRQVDPELAAGLHSNNLVRIIRALEVYRLTGVPLSEYQRRHAFTQRNFDPLQIGIMTDRAELYQRIDARVDRMFADGLLAEAARLVSLGYGRELKAVRGIGYKETLSHLAGEISREDTVRLIKRNTRHYAKRQLTWFRGEPEIIWFEYPQDFARILRIAQNHFEACPVGFPVTGESELT